MLAEVEETLVDGTGIALTMGDGDAAATGHLLKWDSDFFGMSMARIDYVMGDGSAEREEALAAALDAFQARGVEHVAIRVDAADLELARVLEGNHFNLVDSLLTFTLRRGFRFSGQAREMGKIRHFRSEDLPQLVRVAEQAYRGFRSRFHNDPHIPDERADALYPEWARQVGLMRMADVVLVSEGGDGALIGFVGMKRREPVSTIAGIPLAGGAFGACSIDAPGAYAGLLRALGEWIYEQGGMLEGQTQSYNVQAVRVYEAVRATYVRSDYTFHRLLRTT